MVSNGVIVRPRRGADLEALVALLALTQRETGYPVDVAAVRADWLAVAGELGAWVAERDGRLVAHVALHLPHGVSAPVWRAATGRSDDELAVISRLFSRAPGAGSALLTTAIESARALGRAPVLEVQRDSGAYAFYLRRGWTVAGEVEQRWGGLPVSVAALVLTAS